jgi:ribosomal-protein-alanine N-acetyltransferase
MVCLRIIKCSSKHIPRVAELFCQSFSESISFFAPDNKQVCEAIKDIFDLVYRSNGEGFFVAVDEKGSVQGYIVVIDNIRRLWVDAFKTGFVLRIIHRWLAGGYGIGITAALRIIRNKLFFMRFELDTEPAGQILSVAVHPDCQGMGIGRALVGTGLNHLYSLGVNTIKLEVRPGNASALKIYTDYGFVEKGRKTDLQGEWVIMQLSNR